MVMTWETFFMFCTLVVSIISLIISINKKR